MPIHTANLLNSSASLSIVNTTTDNTISVDQNGNVGTSVATDGAVHIENTGNTGIGLGVYSNQTGDQASPLIVAQADNVAFDQVLLSIINDGSNHALLITQNGDQHAIKIYQRYSSSNIRYGLEVDLENGDGWAGGILLHPSSTGTGEAVAINMGSMETTDFVFKVPVNDTDPTSGGGAATGRIPIQTQAGDTRYIAYYA